MGWFEFFPRRPKDAEIEDEIRSHLALAAVDRLAHGDSPEQARRAARVELGNVPLVTEDIRSVWSWTWCESLWKDFQLSIHTLRRQPAFTLIALVALTIGNGSTTAIFSLVNAVLLRPLAVPDGDRIVRFTQVNPYGLTSQMSLPQAGILLGEAGVFHDVSAHRLDLINLTGTTRPEQIPVARLTKNFLRLFRAPLVAGRTFTGDEDRPGGSHVAILSYGLWVRQFGARADMVGQSVSLGSEPYTVIGVLGPGFDSEQFTQAPDVWVPLQLNPNTRDVGGEFCFVNAGLNAGVTLAAANTQLAGTVAEIRRLYPTTNPRLSFAAQPVRDALVTNLMRVSLQVLEGAVALVLLIACANVASLLLVRGTARAREMAVRAAIGARRGRLIRQLITESLVLALGGSVCGLGVGFVGIRVLLAQYPGRNPTLLGTDPFTIPRIGEQASAVTIDWRVVIFTIGVSVVVTIVAGVWPALRTSRVDLHLVLKQTGAGARGGHQTRARPLLVVTEVALAFVLLVGAGLLMRTSLALRAVDPGFDADHVLTMRMSVSGTPFEKRDGIERLTRTGLHRLLAVPGVQAASTACCMPLESVWQLPFVVQGRPLTGPFHAFAGWTFVSPGYFDVFRIPLVRGRDFTDHDDASSPGVVIINQEMARQFWPTSDPLNDWLIIGRAVRPDYNEDPIRQIIGIVGDVRDQALNVKPRPAMYVPIGQVPDGVTRLNVRLLPIVWIARTASEPHALAPIVQQALQDLSGGLPVSRMRSMGEVVAESTTRTRFNTLLMSVFAGSALLLAAVGLYGLIAYVAAQRTPEIGIRLALGATPRDVCRLVIAHGLRPVLVGVAIGTVASWGLTRILAILLFGVSPRDPMTLVAALVLFAAVGLLAAAVPAFRATRVEPMHALRYE